MGEERVGLHVLSNVSGADEGVLVGLLKFFVNVLFDSLDSGTDARKSAVAKTVMVLSQEVSPMRPQVIPPVQAQVFTAGTVYG